MIDSAITIYIGNDISDGKRIVTFNTRFVLSAHKFYSYSYLKSMKTGFIFKAQTIITAIPANKELIIAKLIAIGRKDDVRNETSHILK